MRYSVDKYSVNMWQGTINNSFRKDYCVILFMSKFCLVGLLITSKTPLKQQWWFFHPWHFQQMLTLKQIDIGLVYWAGGKWNSHIGIGKWIRGQRWLLFLLTSIFSSYSKFLLPFLNKHCSSQNLVLHTTFNNISAISWQSVLLVEETGVPGENHRPVASHCQTVSYNASSTPRHERVSNSQL